jgi:hypothetical protein
MLSHGLYDGKTGSVIFFFHYAKYTNNNLYEDFAIELLNDILEDIEHDTNINFDNGLSGIGWAINYLVHTGFIDIDDDYLSDLDSLVMSHDLRRIRDKAVMEGIVCYAKSRMSVLKDYSYEPFDRTYLKDIEAECQRLRLSFNDESKYAFPSVLSMAIGIEPYRDDGLNWQTGLKMIL